MPCRQRLHLRWSSNHCQDILLCITEYGPKIAKQTDKQKPHLLRRRKQKQVRTNTGEVDVHQAEEREQGRRVTLVSAGHLFLGGLGHHTQQYSALTSGSVLRDYL